MFITDEQFEIVKEKYGAGIADRARNDKDVVKALKAHYESQNGKKMWEDINE